MDVLMKAAACVLMTLVLYWMLAKQDKDISVILSVIVCTMIAAAAVTQFEPVFSFLKRLGTAANLDNQLLQILFKAVAISLIGEITGLICTDAGNSALAKGLQLLASVLVLMISLPLFEALLELIEGLLAAL